MYIYTLMYIQYMYMYISQLHVSLSVCTWGLVPIHDLPDEAAIDWITDNRMVATQLFIIGVDRDSHSLSGLSAHSLMM